MSGTGAHLLSSTLDGLEDGALQAVPQSADGVSHAPKVTVEAARVRWDRPAAAVHRQIRAVTPAPGAWTMVGELRIKIGAASIGAGELTIGRIEVRKDGVYVGTATDPIRLERIQPPGKKMMAALDWARGARLDEEAVAQ